MKFNQAKRLLQTNIDDLNEYELQMFKGKLNSLFWLLNGTHGEKSLFDGGFIIPVVDNSASGFVPKDKFMFTNLKRLMEDVDNKIKGGYVIV